MRTVWRFVRDNSLVTAIMGLGFIFLVLTSIFGYESYLKTLRTYHLPIITYGHYLISGTFLFAISTNFAADFLQLVALTVGTTHLYQRGAAESHKSSYHAEEDRQHQREEESEAQTREKASGHDDAPWPVRKGGFILVLYRHSLSIALVSGFLLSVVMEAISGVMYYNFQQREVHQPQIGILRYVGTSEFWTQVLANWQSGLLIAGLFLVLTIFLREVGSPQSKPVAKPNTEEGTDD